MSHLPTLLHCGCIRAACAAGLVLVDQVQQRQLGGGQHAAAHAAEAALAVAGARHMVHVPEADISYLGRASQPLLLSTCTVSCKHLAMQQAASCAAKLRLLFMFWLFLPVFRLNRLFCHATAFQTGIILNTVPIASCSMRCAAICYCKRGCLVSICLSFEHADAVL